MAQSSRSLVACIAHEVPQPISHATELVLTDELPSMTIPDDPQLHQLLRQLHAEVLAELRRQGKTVEVRKLPPGLVPRVQGGSSTRPHEGCPGGNGRCH